MSFDDDDEETTKLVAPADFNGPTGNRHCTDVLCSLLLLIMWAALTVIGIMACTDGDYRVVLYPLDYDGNICGTDNMTEYPYLLYINSYTGGVCVKECPSLAGQVENNVTDVRTLVTYGGIWQAEGAELPADFVEMGNYTTSEDALFCSSDKCFPNNKTHESWTSEGINQGFGYAYYVGDTVEILWRCYLTDEAEDAIQEQVESSNATSLVPTGQAGYSFWNNFYADIWTARYYVLGFGFGVAVGISFLYTILMRLPLLLNFVVWGSVLVTIAMFGLAGYYAVSQAQEWNDQEPQVYDDTTIRATRITGYVLFGVGALLALVMCCLRKQLQLAVGCVKETAKGLIRMPLIISIPVLQAAGFIAFMIVFMIYAVHLASLGQISVFEFPTNINTGAEVAVRTYSFDDYVYRCAWYFLFCFFWTSSFIVAAGDMMVAMCFAKWYFSKDKSTVGSRTVISSVYDTLRYHLGTCAYGALILALINLVRAIIARLQKTLKKYNSHCVDMMLCCCQCCLCCFEKCMKFLNKNAYVQTAIFGTSFCTSSRRGFFLVVRNAARVGAISSVSSAILFVGKLFISTVTTSLAYYAMNESSISDELYSIGGPTVMVFLISYFISDFFMDIYDMGTTTILHCFIADEEMFNGDECYAEGQLQSFIDKNAD